MKKAGLKFNGDAVVAVLTVTVLVFALLIHASAANAPQEQNCAVGTEVQGDMGGGAKGKIAEIGTESPHIGWYRIVFNWNAPKGDWYDPKSWNIRVVGSNNRCVVGGAPNKAAPDKPNETATGPTATSTSVRVDDNGTVLADRDLLECPIKQKSVRPNSQPQAEVLKKVIRCLFEKPAPTGTDGAQTVDISSFQIGASRKWIPISDIGSGNRNTNVYPVKVSWTWKRFYRTQTQVQENINIFNCYVNAVGEWECGNAQRIKTGEIKRIPVQ